jgi:hypothetical protein
MWNLLLSQKRLRETIARLEGQTIHLSQQNAAMEQELANARQLQDFAHRERQQELSLKHKQEVAELKAQKIEQVARARLDRDEFEARMKRQMDENILLNRLKTEETVSKARAEHQAEMVEVRADEARKRLDFEAKLSSEYYEKLSAALAKLHSEGNAHTTYVKDVFMKVLEQVPSLQRLSIGVNDTRSVGGDGHS